MLFQRKQVCPIEIPHHSLSKDDLKDVIEVRFKGTYCPHFADKDTPHFLLQKHDYCAQPTFQWPSETNSTLNFAT